MSISRATGYGNPTEDHSLAVAVLGEKPGRVNALPFHAARFSPCADFSAPYSGLRGTTSL